jgi:hypothetical protein
LKKIDQGIKVFDIRLQRSDSASSVATLQKGLNETPVFSSQTLLKRYQMIAGKQIIAQASDEDDASRRNVG